MRKAFRRSRQADSGLCHFPFTIFHRVTGRPGPVLVDIPKDILQAPGGFSWPPVLDLPGYHPTTRPHAKQVREAARLMASAQRPVLYVGGGVLKARAAAELRVLAELTGIPVVTTLMARGAFPDSHPQHLGMPGMHGSVAAVTALQKSDLLISLGARFDDRVTGKLSSFAPDAAIIHARPSGYSFLPELADCPVQQVSIETAQSGLDTSVLTALSDKTVMVGVLDLSDPEVESVDTVVARARRALAHVAPERMVLAPDCGMKYLPRASADGKMRAMAEAAQVLRRG